MSNETISLPALPDQFRAAALALPDRVREALPSIVSAMQAADALAKAEAMGRYAKQIKCDTESVNAIQEAKLLLQAKLGGFMVAETPAERGAKGGRGKKAPVGTTVALASHTKALYRKITAHADKIEEYAEKVAEANRKMPDDALEPVEMSSAGFLRFVGSDGALCTKHNNNIIEWYTPEKYIEAARLVMGSIDLDPASSDAAQKVVKAATHYTARDDGLTKEWSGNVFLNPPYKMPLIHDFCFRLCAEVESQNVRQAVLLTNDNTDTQWWHRSAATASAICFHVGRVSFYNAAGQWSSPTNGQTLFYFGTRVASFCKRFGEFGLCLKR
jgi:phage N-6-adenine-methyltransferase